MKDSSKMTARVWTKPNLQKVLTQVRRSDKFEVKKVSDFGYEVIFKPKDLCVLRAMNGRNSYLVRFDTRLFSTG